MDKNIVFFGESGLTSTSANHVANLAKEYAKKQESELNAVCFYNTQIGLIGTDVKNTVSIGISEEQLLEIPAKLEEVTKAKSLIAWLREAIKARDAMFDAANKKDIEEWYKERGLEFWNAPSRPTQFTKDDIIATLNIKERNHIYTLETKCAVIGKYIHPDGPFSTARKKLSKISNARFEVHGEGRDAMVYQFDGTVSISGAEQMFFKLQAEHRANQAELNKILHEIDERVREANMAQNAQYAEKLREWDVAGKKQLAEFEAWKSEETKRIADLKIVIPDHLKGIYETVNALGK